MLESAPNHSNQRATKTKSPNPEPQDSSKAPRKIDVSYEKTGIRNTEPPLGTATAIFFPFLSVEEASTHAQYKHRGPKTWPN